MCTPLRVRHLINLRKMLKKKKKIIISKQRINPLTSHWATFILHLLPPTHYWISLPLSLSLSLHWNQGNQNRSILLCFPHFIPFPISSSRRERETNWVRFRGISGFGLMKWLGSSNIKIIPYKLDSWFFELRVSIEYWGFSVWAKSCGFSCWLSMKFWF